MGGTKGLMGGILIAYFMYSGWDAAIYVNEETTDRANNPGKAAIASVAMLAAIYSLATFAFQSVLSPDELQAHAGDALSAVGVGCCTALGAVMALVVLTGTLATLQAAVVSAARMGLAMSRDRVMPAVLSAPAGGRLDALGGDLDHERRESGRCSRLLSARRRAGGAHQRREQPGAHLHRLLRHHRRGGRSAHSGATMTSSAQISIFGGLFPLIGVLFSFWVLVGSLVTGAVTPGGHRSTGSAPSRSVPAWRSFYV